MAEITAEGYSFIDDSSAATSGYAASLRNYIISDRTPREGFAFTFPGGPYFLSDRSPKLGWAKEFTGEMLQIWQNPIFIQAYCPATGPTRPATGQVYPRGYS